jgi:hypothetical protein
MSQLKNIVQVFQNNDLVTAAKLNSLVNDTTLDVGAVTAQAVPTASIANTDVVLGYELASNTLVQIPISQLLTLGAPIHSNVVQSFGDSDIEINQYNTNRAIELNASATGSYILISNPQGPINLSTATSNRKNSRVYVSNGPFEVQESVRITGQTQVVNMTSVIGSPILNFTSVGPHGVQSAQPIELIGPTAEFTGVFVPTNVSDSTFNITLPQNATAANTNTPVTVARPAIDNKQLSYLSRLNVTGAAKFGGATEFTSVPTIKGVQALQLYEIQEITITTPWTATYAGFYNGVFVSPTLTKPANEIWYVDGFAHVNTTGYGTTVGIRYSNVAAQTGQYLTLNYFTDSGNGSTVLDYNWQYGFVIPSATTFTNISLTFDAYAGNGSAARMFHTASFQNMFGGASAPVWPQSKLTIHKYKTA